MGFEWWHTDTDAETTQPGVRVQDIVARLRAEQREERLRADAEGWPDEAAPIYAQLVAAARRDAGKDVRHG